ncbi:unnamed protein product [Polarella glacialis]|uniref:AB hydrolase-1 domain-containing protein n=1 Tax=Polarella glacialis TaxID=89957 RepID=A0A813F0J4_POLGL|nr:unnamed protein product [Polarella glacialis]
MLPPPTAAEEAKPAPKEKKDEPAEEAKPAPKEEKDEPAGEAQPAPEEKKDEPAGEAKPAPEEKKDEPPSRPDPSRSGKRVRHAGAQLSYQVFGDRTSKNCLFFIHRVEGNSFSFFQNIPHFAKDYFVISFSVRSFGASMMDGDDAGLFEVKHFAGDVLAVLDAEEVTAPVVIVGHSFGGMSAVRMAMENPERVAAIVMSNTCVGFKDGEGADAMGKCILAVDPKIRIALAVEARPPSIDPERKSNEDRASILTSTSKAFIDKQPVLFSLMG